MMGKTKWLKAILQCLIELSDKEFQYRVWFNGENAPESSSFNELMCRLFDDYDFEKSIYFYDISNETKKNLIELGAILSLQEEIDTKNKLDTEDWNEVIRKALKSKEIVENEILSLTNTKSNIKV